MRMLKLGLGLLMAAGLFAVVLPGADARIATFGDSSYAFGTPLDDDGNQTVCSDGFELIAASTPNQQDIPIGVGLPTGLVDGSIVNSLVAGVYDAALVDNFQPFELSSFSFAGGFNLVDGDGNPAATNYGYTSVPMVASDTFFALPPSDPAVNKPADAIGSIMFTPTSLLPVGQDVVIVTGDYPGFGSNRRVTVVDCTPPVDLEVDVVLKNKKVRPDRPWKNLRVNILNDGTFDASTIADIEIAGATPFREKIRDVDGDGDLDLKVRVKTGHTTIECGDTSMTVTGTIDGEPFETVVPIETKCKKSKW